MPAASLLQPGAVSANRAPPRASVSDESGLVDRRRWTSFLTWAFVLSEMAGRDGWLPTAAHAGEEDLGRSGHAGSDTAPIVNNLPTISVSTATEGPEPITYQHAATMPAYAPTGLSSELAEAKITPAEETDRVRPRSRWRRRWWARRQRGDRRGGERRPRLARRCAVPRLRPGRQSAGSRPASRPRRHGARSPRASSTASATSRWSAISWRMSARVSRRRQATCCRCSNPSFPCRYQRRRLRVRHGGARPAFLRRWWWHALPMSWRHRAAATRPTASH